MNHNKIVKSLIALSLLLAILVSCLAGCKEQPEEASSEPVSETASKEVSSEEPSQTIEVEKKPLTEEEKAMLQHIWEHELDFLASMQLSNGALPMTKVPSGNVNMNPYFADTAAEALLTAGTKYQDVVKNYIRWHFAHLNTAEQDEYGVDGTIYDYIISVDGTKALGEKIVINDTGEKHYDSSDSYAGTFLSLLRNYAETTGDQAFLKPYYQDVNRIYGALVHTLSLNNLTNAKPDWGVEYLMDNCEAHKGLVDVTWLYEHVYQQQKDAKDRAAAAKSTAEKMIKAIHEEMWVEEDKAYVPSLMAASVNWDVFYADAACQLFPILFDIDPADGERSKFAYYQFNQHFGNGQPGTNWQNFDIPQAHFWALIPRTAAIMGDSASVVTYMNRYQKFMKRHVYPLYNADIGHAAIACRILLDREENQSSAGK